jgi:hypothetical protein
MDVRLVTQEAPSMSLTAEMTEAEADVATEPITGLRRSSFDDR